MNSKFKVEISLDEESKKLLKEVLKRLKQLKVNLNEQAFKEFVHSTIRDISLKD